MKNITPKKLIIREPEDLKILAALLQDAALTKADLAYDKPVCRFALMANRFVWEDRGLFRRRKGWRQRCALHFNYVSGVKTQGLIAGDENQILSLLTITITPTAGSVKQSDHNITIRFIFSGSVSVQITADSLDAVLTDIGDPWEALGRPEHR